jgi:hypothetical protein
MKSQDLEGVDHEKRILIRYPNGGGILRQG